MPILFHYGRGGLPEILIKCHDFMVKDILSFFEKGKWTLRKNREARKTIVKALRIAKKKQRNPGVMIGTALKTIRGMDDEVEHIRKVLKATYVSLEESLDQIQMERIEEPIALIENAQVSFEKKNFKKGMALLQEAKEKVGKKVLLKTRTAIFGGISGDVRDMKRELSKSQKLSSSKKVPQKAKALCHRVKDSTEKELPPEVMSITGADTVITGVATIETEG